MSRLVIKNFSLLTISNFVNQFILVFSGIKIARTLGPASYGVYSYLFVQMSLYAVISDLGLRNIIIRTIARDQEQAKGVFFSSVSLQLLGLILCTIIMLIYESFAHSVAPVLIIYIVLAILLTNLWATCESVWQGHQRMGVPAFINVFYSVVWIIFVLLTPSRIFTVEFLFKYYCYSQILQVGTLFLCMFFVKGILSGKATELINTGVGILKQSSSYYLNNLMTLPTNALSNNFLEINTTKTELGYFNTSNRLMGPVRTVINLGLSALFPNISALWSKDKAELLKKVSVGFPIFIIAFGCICFSFTLLCKEIVMLLFGAKFLPSTPIMRYQIWFLFIFALNCFIGTVWGATDKQKLLAKSGIINSLIATPFLWIGSKYGGLGLAYAYLIAYSLYFPMLYFVFKRSLNLNVTITKEAFIVIGMFACSVYMPTDGTLWIRILLILLIIIILLKLYYKQIKYNLLLK